MESSNEAEELRRWHLAKLWHLLNYAQSSGSPLENTDWTWTAESATQINFLADLSASAEFQAYIHRTFGVSLAFFLDSHCPSVKILCNSFESLIASVDQCCQEKDLFDTVDTATNVVRCAKGIIASHCEFDAEKVEAINVKKIEFSGGDMAGWELEPQTGCENIFWPNPYEFHVEHIDAYRKANPAGLAKMYMSYALYAFCDAAHEKDSSQNWWRLEHDASVTAMNILNLISRDDRLSCIPRGVFELVCVQIEKDVNYSHVLVTEDERNGYLAWRDSFGAVPPVESDSDNHAASPVVNYLKERLALDALRIPTTQLTIDSERSQLVSSPEDKLAAYENCNRLVKLHLNLLFNSERRNVDVKDFQISLSEEGKSRNFCRVRSL